MSKVLKIMIWSIIAIIIIGLCVYFGFAVAEEKRKASGYNFGSCQSKIVYLENTLR